MDTTTGTVKCLVDAVGAAASKRVVGAEDAAGWVKSAWPVP